MAEQDTLKTAMRYVLSGGLGKVKTNKKGKELKQITIDGLEFKYDKDKPFTGRLKKQLNDVLKRPAFKRFEILDKAVKGVRVRKALSRYAISTIGKRTDNFTALKAYANTYSITNIERMGFAGLGHIYYQKSRLREFLNKNKSMKLLIDVEFVLEYIDTLGGVGEGEDFLTPIRSRRYNILNEEDLNKAVNNAGNDVQLILENKQLKKSGLRLKKVNKITIHYDKYDPTRAGQYIELPRWIQLKKACINIKNYDNLCFKYCVLCRFYEIHKKDHPERLHHYNKLIETDNFIKWDGVEFPACNEDIDKFETVNDNTISVNVYTIDKDVDKIRADRITKITNPRCHINLLRLDEEHNNHYALIKDYSRLLGGQTNKKTNKQFYCHYCQKGFTKENLLQAHLLKGCMANEVQAIEMPEEKEKMSFQKHYKKLKCPYVIYGDFECLTTLSNEGLKGAYPMQPKGAYQNHKASGFMLNVVNSITGEAKPYLYRGEDCMDVFCKTLNTIREEIFDVMNNPKDMETLTHEQKGRHLTAKRCFICNGRFEPNVKAKTKVADHCHFTGKYRGAAHHKCNLDYCFKYFKIPIFFHNLKNYDAHLVISNLDKLNTKKDDVSVIAQNSEKFITFCLKQLEFKDSFSFLSSSLDKLVKLTKYEDNAKRNDWISHFKYSKMSEYVKDDYDLDLLTDKGVYPYDYMNEFKKFNETELPDKKEFYSRLGEEDISDKDYERAQHIWKHFKIKNLGEYHDLYLKTDVLLLTDIFENFRNQCLIDYELDPAHYYTLPNFAWDAMLLKTGIQLDLIYNEDLYKMIERGLRGGMCQCTLKLAEANNKYMKEKYDENKPSSYINYLDANNLYGLAMCQKLPYKDIKFVEGNFTEEHIHTWSDLGYGFILDVDLEYPKELHDKHNDYPLAPEIMNITADMLSDTQKEIYKSYHFNKTPKDEKTNKLVLNVNNKENYVVHIKVLKYYLQQGMKIKKINRVVQFRQKEWLKPWIDFNTGKRKQAKSDFEKDLYKLMNNSCFGKTMENVREHINFELVDTPERFQKVVNSPTYKHRHIINENLVGVEKLKETVKLNKPIYVGMSILDLSKLHMYSFYYDVLKKKYNDDVRLIYTDTDSFVIHTKTEDIYDDFKGISKYMDFSDYEKNHKCYDATNKKVLGKFKDECQSKIITNFIALKPKSYAFKLLDTDKEEKKNKGVPKHKVKNQLNYKAYLDTLETNSCPSVSFNSIRSKNHQIYSINQVKQALSSFDNKRYWLDNINSLPYGHYRINT